MGSVCHLVDIDRVGRRHRPTSSSSAGARSRRTASRRSACRADVPMCVDLVADGPHGLVGGTSGSGKTEFLKTLFCRLCAQQPSRRPVDRDRRLQGRRRPRRGASRCPTSSTWRPTSTSTSSSGRSSLLRAESMRRQEPARPRRRQQHRFVPGGPGRAARAAAAAAPPRGRRRVRRAARQRGRARAVEGARSRSPASDARSGCTCCSSPRTSRQPAPADRRQRRPAHLPARPEAGALQGRARLRGGGDDQRPQRRARLRPVPRP